MFSVIHRKMALTFNICCGNGLVNSSVSRLRSSLYFSFRARLSAGERSITGLTGCEKTKDDENNKVSVSKNLRAAMEPFIVHPNIRAKSRITHVVITIFPACRGINIKRCWRSAPEHRYRRSAKSAESTRKRQKRRKHQKR